MTVNWINGELTDSVAVPGLIPGVLTGMGLFETMLVKNKTVGFLDQHLDRLKGAIDRVGIAPIDFSAIRAAVGSVVRGNAEIADLARLRVTVLAGSAGGESTILITMTAFEGWPATAEVMVLAWTVNSNRPLAGIKSTSYAENMLMLKHAQNLGYSEGLVFNERGELSEGTASNVFLAVDGELITPPLLSGCLPGIIRGLLLQAGIAREKIVRGEDLARSEEIFLTSSTRGVHPVSRLGDRVLQAPGPQTAQAFQVYSSL